MIHQDNSINHNYAGANINNGNGIIISGNAQVTNSLNTNTSSGASAKNSNTANWGPRSDNRYRADNSGHKQNYHNNYYNGDRDDILERQRAKKQTGSMDKYLTQNSNTEPIDIDASDDDLAEIDPNDFEIDGDDVIFIKDTKGDKNVQQKTT